MVGKSAGVGDWEKCRCGGLGKVQDRGKMQVCGVGESTGVGVGKSAGSLHLPFSCLDSILKTEFQCKIAPVE